MASAIFARVSSDGNGVAVLDAREVAAEQAGAAFDIALREAAVAAIRPDHFADVYFRLFFGHRIFPTNRAYLTSYTPRAAQENSPKCS